MKLTVKDKKILSDMGYSDKDFNQIEKAISITKYTAYGREITPPEAIKILGISVFLSGISRSAFHWSAIRYANDEIECNTDDNSVYFDSSALFN